MAALRYRSLLQKVVSLRKLHVRCMSQAAKLAQSIAEVHGVEARQLLTSQPFVVRGLAKEWPAMTSWKGGAAFRAHSNALIPVEMSPADARGSYLDPRHEVTSLPFGLFLDYVFVATTQEREALPRLYLAQHALLDQLPALAADVPTPDLLLPITAAGHSIRRNVWVGPPSVATPPHRDPYHNLYVVVQGEKYVRLWAATESARMYPSTDPLQGNTSTVDDVYHPGPSFPDFPSAPYWDTTLQAGDALHIPQAWWHYVEGTAQASIAVSHWWDPPRKKSDKSIHGGEVAGYGTQAQQASTSTGEGRGKMAQDIGTQKREQGNTGGAGLGPPPKSKKDRIKPIPR